MDNINEELEFVTYSPGEVIFTENDQSYHFIIIQDGQVEVYKSGAGGVKIPLAIVGSGASLGEFAMIDRLPRSATARAVTPVTAVKISDVAYEKLLADLPEWAVSVMKALVERLRHTNELIRRAVAVDQRIQTEIERAEQEVGEESTNTGTIQDENPFLSNSDDEEQEHRAMPGKKR